MILWFSVLLFFTHKLLRHWTKSAPRWKAECPQVAGRPVWPPWQNDSGSWPKSSQQQHSYKGGMTERLDPPNSYFRLELPSKSSNEWSFKWSLKKEVWVNYSNKGQWLGQTYCWSDISNVSSKVTKCHWSWLPDHLQNLPSFKNKNIITRHAAHSTFPF